MRNTRRHLASECKSYVSAMDGGRDGDLLVWDDGVNRFIGPDRSRKWLVDDDGLGFNFRVPTSKRWVSRLGEQLAAETDVDLTIVSDAELDGYPLGAWDYDFVRWVDAGSHVSSSRPPLLLNTGPDSELGEARTAAGREKMSAEDFRNSRISSHPDSELRDPWDATDKTVILPPIPDADTEPRAWQADGLFDIYLVGYI